MSFETASLVSRFEESKTLALAARAKQLAAEGRTIVNFGLGEPDFNTPDIVLEAAATAMKKGQTKYTPVGGTLSLRKAIAARLSEDYGVPFSHESIVVSAGGKQAIFHFLQAILEPGDEVIIPAPYWVSFPEMVKMVGGVPKIAQPSGERLVAKDIERQITAKTKLLILNSPSNPTGEVYSPEEVASFLSVIRSRPIWLMSDDTYYSLIYSGDPFVSALKIAPDFRERTCVIGSTSKSYAMTGWRLGWASVPDRIVSAMVKLQSQITSNPCSVSQAAAEVAVQTKNHLAITTDFKARFQKRRDHALGRLKSLEGLSMPAPDGAFYLFLRLAPLLRAQTATSFAQELLEKWGVCAIPGEAFGAPDYLRLSYALSEAEISAGIDQIEKALKG